MVRKGVELLLHVIDDGCTSSLTKGTSGDCDTCCLSRMSGLRWQVNEGKEGVDILGVNGGSPGGNRSSLYCRKVPKEG